MHTNGGLLKGRAETLLAVSQRRVKPRPMDGYTNVFAQSQYKS
jgi:hypothetical protein